MDASRFLNLKQAINKNVETIDLQDDQRESFLKSLNELYTSIVENKHKREEPQKDIFRDFLQKLIPDKFINPSGDIDLAIYNGSTSRSSVGVIIEYKKTDNKAEMMSADKLNVKGFQELVAYYLKERIYKKNNEIHKGIVTNGLSYFVIESNQLERFFMNNRRLVTEFKKFENKQLVDQTTSYLFSKIIAPEIDKALAKGIKIGHFDLRDCIAKSTGKFKERSLTQLYRFFSAQNLLNEMVFADPNSLNRDFYNELLYIMGLTENKKGSKKVIDRLKEKDRQSASLLENTITQLDLNGVPKEKQFNIALQLVVIWINRILFLKLLESSLIAFNHSEKYRFLNKEKINSFDQLNMLFFGVMAKPVSNRNEEINKEFPYVPYMNSSLFEQSDLEKSGVGITINNLMEGDIEVYSKTKLKDRNGKKLKGKISIIDYLFDFLSAYDFRSSSIGADSKKEQNQLINASVLGLIFEKINGYKDGSFFTPGKITMYMAKRAIRQAVLTKINEGMHWHYPTLQNLVYAMQDFQGNITIDIRKKISKLIDSIKILDPAVGSGHFLVSTLDELIGIKASLRVLFDAEGKLMNDVSCTVVNDELIVQEANGNNYSYDANNPSSLRIQKALFQQKKIIIENCLFGVDLNPNSVNICRLRLWIELLKNAYYSVNAEGHRVLTTLPNIDINIKVGDSLIHRFSLNSRLNMNKTTFKRYLSLVSKYKETSDKNVKTKINTEIYKIKNSFYDGIMVLDSPEYKAYRKASWKFNDAQNKNIFGESNVDQATLDKLKTDLDEKKEAYDSVKDNPIYARSLEWRIEFPEVLDENGNFVGFDVVIANPPYVSSRNKAFSSEAKRYYLKNYQVDEFHANTYTLFLELGFYLIKQGGTLAYIVPNNMLTLPKNQKIRNFLLKKSGRLIVINSLDKIFKDASVDNCLIFFQKKISHEITVGELKQGIFTTIGTINKKEFGVKNPVISISMVKYKSAIPAFRKIDKQDSFVKKHFGTVKNGIIEYILGEGKPPVTKYDKDHKVFDSSFKVDSTYLPHLEGKDINRYSFSWQRQYIKYGPNLSRMRDPKIFIGPRILVRQIPVRSVYCIKANYTNKHFITDGSTLIITDIKNIKPLSLLGVINSKPLTLWFLIKLDKFQRRTFPRLVAKDLSRFPVPNMTEKMQDKISYLVKIIIDKAKKSQNYVKENEEVDELVMDAFHLTKEEKQSIRDFTF